MGTQSTSPLLRTTRVLRRTTLLLALASPQIVSAQTSVQTSALTVPLLLPSAIVFDAAGNLFLAETANHVIRKVDTTGHITTIAGTGVQGFSGDNGPATAATLDSPQALALDSIGNLYLADTHNHRIRRIDASTQIITTIAGTGAPGYSGDDSAAATAQLALPTAVAFDRNNNLYFADTGNHRIRKIAASTNIITTIAGNGTQGFSGDAGLAIAAAIDSPAGLACDTANSLYLADTHNHRIRRIDTTTQIITTIAGTGAAGYSGDTAAATAATLALPHGLTIDPNGNLYLADTHNHRIRRIDATTGIITTVAGDGTQTFAGDNAPAITASIDSPLSAAVSPAALLTLADTNNQRIRQLTAAAAPATTIETIAGIGASTPGALVLTAPSVIAYGTGQIIATLASATPATGLITFFDANATLGTAPLTSNTATLSTSSLPAGTHTITATYAGDQTHLVAQTSTFPLTIAPQQLTANLAPVTLLYGQTIPAITATLSGILPQDTNNLLAAFTTTATTLSPAGTYPITANLTGSAAGNYALAPISATITINPAPTTVTLTDNLIANATNGSPVTFTATVTSSRPKCNRLHHTPRQRRSHLHRTSHQRSYRLHHLLHHAGHALLHRPLHRQHQLRLQHLHSATHHRNQRRPHTRLHSGPRGHNLADHPLRQLCHLQLHHRISGQPLKPDHARRHRPSESRHRLLQPTHHPTRRGYQHLHPHHCHPQHHCSKHNAEILDHHLRISPRRSRSSQAQADCIKNPGPRSPEPHPRIH